MPRHVTIEKFAELSGYTPKAIRQKKADGVWPAGVWIKAPDGRMGLVLGNALNAGIYQ